MGKELPIYPPVALERNPTLSQNESDILELVSHGVTVAQTARDLFYNKSSVSRKLAYIRRQLGASTTAQAVRIGFECSILQAQPTPDLAAQFTDTLSPKEFECVFMISEGLLYKQIAHRLNISVRTVESQAGSAQSKLRAKNQVHIMRRMVEFGIIDWRERSYRPSQDYGEQLALFEL